MKLGKRLSTLVLALCMVLGLSALMADPAQAATYRGSCGPSANWSFDSDTGVLNITGSGEMNNYSWNTRAPWDSYLEQVTTIIVENGITTIGSCAFGQVGNRDYDILSGCAVTSVSLPDTITSIGNDAFIGCRQLPSIKLPANLTHIGRSAFNSCDSLTSIDIPDSVTTMGWYAFRSCTSLTSVHIPTGVSELVGTFSECKSLTSVTVPGNVKKLAYEQLKSAGGAFDGCTSLTSVTLEPGVEEIDNYTFRNCVSLSEISLPRTLRSIGIGAFQDCKQLVSITLPEGLQKIGNLAFYRASLTDVVIPTSVNLIGGNAFEMDSLDTITVLSPNCLIGSYTTGPTLGGIVGKTLVRAYDESTAYESAVKTGLAFESLGKLMTFSDVAEDAYYWAPVTWAVREDITSGTGVGAFTPDAVCTQEQVLTFLWRAQGSPEPTIANPFANLETSAYYAKAVTWAYEKGLVSGTAVPAGPCSRADTVMYLWKLAGRPATGSASFSDVPAGSETASAVAWAVGQGITNGTGESSFSPAGTCTRGQIVTFLYRAMA